MEWTSAAAVPSPVRDPALDALLRDVDQLRLTLETDLSLVAAAVEADDVPWAVEVLEQDSHRVHAFESRALSLLGQDEDVEAGSGTRWVRRGRLLNALPAAAAVAAVLALGALTAPGSDQPPSTSAAQSDRVGPDAEASRSFDALADLLVPHADVPAVRAAADRLNVRVESLTRAVPADPAAATTALGLLRAEQRVLEEHPNTEELQDLIDRNEQLTTQVLAGLPSALEEPSTPSIVANLPRPVPSVPAVAPSPRPRPPAVGPPTTPATRAPSAAPTVPEG